MKEIYPLTIISDRYNGTYSGAQFIAFNEEHNELPEEINGNDVDCRLFWIEKAKKYTIGKGNTPNEASENLKVLLKIAI